MTTLAIMQARIASELRRSDLTSQIASAINDAISTYQKERFRFSDSQPSAPTTFATVAGRDVYTSADNANIASLYKIDQVMILIGNTQQRLEQEHPTVLRLYNQQGTMQGQPTWWAYESNQLILSPIPPAVYTVTLEMFRNVAAPVDDAEVGNPWMVTAERLIRSRAKYELALHVTRNADMAASMSPDPPGPGQPTGASYRAWRELKGETNRVTSRGRVRPMAF